MSTNKSIKLSELEETEEKDDTKVFFWKLCKMELIYN